VTIAASMTKPFPEKRYTVRLREGDNASWERLAQVTELRDRLVTVPTKGKLFIGQVQPGRFHLIGAAIGRGAFCTFTGQFVDGIGSIDVRVHRIFRALILVWLLLPLGAVLFTLISQGAVAGFLQLAVVILMLVVLRLGIGVVFKSIAGKAIRDLSRVLDFTSVEEIKIP
jgi:hypothetical protein